MSTYREERVQNMVSYLHGAHNDIREAEFNLRRAKSRADDLETNLADAVTPPDLKPGEKLTVLVGDLFFEVWLETQEHYPVELPESQVARKPEITYKKRIRTRP